MARRSALVREQLAKPPKGRAPKIHPLTEVAESTGVLTTPEPAPGPEPQADSPTSSGFEPSPEPDAQVPSWILDLVMKRRRSDTPTASRLINVPTGVKERFDALSRRLEIDPRLGEGLHPLNASAVLELACVRYAANPSMYSAADTSRGSRKFSGHVTAGAWNSMEVAWAGSENRGPHYGAHLASAITEILSDVDAALGSVD